MSKVLGVLRAILADDIALVPGCREFVKLVGTLDPPLARSDAVATLVAVESETDDFPLGEVRKQWSQEALERQDRALQVYMRTVADDVVSACRTLEKELSVRMDEPEGR